jgi:hypothetical protein
MSRQFDNLLKTAASLYLIARVAQIEPRVLSLLAVPKKGRTAEKADQRDHHLLGHVNVSCLDCVSRQSAKAGDDQTKQHGASSSDEAGILVAYLDDRRYVLVDLGGKGLHQLVPLNSLFGRVLWRFRSLVGVCHVGRDESKRPMVGDRS